MGYAYPGPAAMDHITWGAEGSWVNTASLAAGLPVRVGPRHWGQSPAKADTRAHVIHAVAIQPVRRVPTVGSMR